MLLHIAWIVCARSSSVSVNHCGGVSLLDYDDYYYYCYYFHNQLFLFVRRYGKQDTIFIATDDQKVIEEAIKDKNHKFVFQNISREKYTPKGWGHTIDTREDLNKPSVVTEFMQDIVAMSMCGMFVGTFTSSIGWLVVELQVTSCLFFVVVCMYV